MREHTRKVSRITRKASPYRPHTGVPGCAMGSRTLETGPRPVPSGPLRARLTILPPTVNRFSGQLLLEAGRDANPGRPCPPEHSLPATHAKRSTRKAFLAAVQAATASFHPESRALFRTQFWASAFGKVLHLFCNKKFSDNFLESPLLLARKPPKLASRLRPQRTPRAPKQFSRRPVKCPGNRPCQQ